MKEIGLERFQELIGYEFHDKQLLYNALTHSSFIKANSHKNDANNERLEFLGDAVLGLCVGEEIFRTYPHISEGVMSRVRAASVCETALYEAAKKMQIPSVIRLGYGESVSGGRDKPSILSDAVEALIGAIYLDGGLEEARKFIFSFTDIESSYHSSRQKDDKTKLQEYVQEKHMGTISYDVISVTGPDHNHVFTMEVKINDITYGKGTGHSKHEAGKNAAAQALCTLAKMHGNE